MKTKVSFVALVRAGIALLAFIPASHAAKPQPGTRDPSFESLLGAPLSDIVLQPDGKIVIVGHLLIGPDGYSHVSVIRLNAEGDQDAGFSLGTGVSGPVIGGIDMSINSYPAFRVALGKDGQLVVVGLFARINGVVRDNVARLTGDGSVDANFNPPTFVRRPFQYSHASAVAVQEDGRLLIGGGFNRVNGLTRNYLVRLNTNGSLDATFDVLLDNPEEEAGGAVDGILLQADGKILIRGYFVNVQGIALPWQTPSLVRLNSDGSLDSVMPERSDLLQAVQRSRKSFGTSEDFFAVEADGRILTGLPHFTPELRQLVRKTADGQVDDGFNFIPGAGPPAPVAALALQPDGMILAAGNGLVRLFSGDATPVAPVISRQPTNHTVSECRNGFFDIVGYGFPKPTYQWRLNGMDLPGETNASLTVVKTQPTNESAYSVFVSNAAGSVLSDPASLTILPPSKRPGEVDLCFAPQILFTQCGFCLDLRVQRGLLVQPDDKVLVAGEGLRRLNADGGLDTNFDPGLRNPSFSGLPLVTDLALQNDGRILICGTFTNVHNTRRNGIARLHVDGRLDESFDPGNRIPDGVRSIAWQTNGQVLIAGTFTNVNGFPRNGIARLHDDGGLDTDFNPGAGAAPTAVDSVMLQSDGAVLLAGGFTSIDGVSRRGFARLRAGGSVDPDFNVALTTVVSGGPFGPPRLLAVQPDGKIWITGTFGSASNLVRLRTDGNIDLQIARPYFSVPSPTPLSLALQPDGKVIVSGRRSPMERLYPDGRVDPTFVAPLMHYSGNPRSAQFIALQSSGHIVVSGDFSHVGGEPRPGLARLYGGELPFFAPTFVTSSLRYSQTGASLFQFRIVGYPGAQLVVEATSSLGSPAWTPILTNTITAAPIILTDTNTADFRQRFYRVVSP